MKTLRLLLLLGVTAMLAAVVRDYVGTQNNGPAAAAGEPEVLPSNLDSKAAGWRWSQSSGESNKVEIRAASFRQIKETMLFELEDVELRIYQEGSPSFDLVTSKSAEFDPATETLYSESEVTILLDVREGQDFSRDPPTRIVTTGVTFETKSGVARTDRETQYYFENGFGRSAGAFYHSTHRYFRMDSEVYLEKHSPQADRAPLKIRGAELTYFEEAQRVELKGPAQLERGSRLIEAPWAALDLVDGAIRRIEADYAKGKDHGPGGETRFQADKVEVRYSPDQVLEQVTGKGDATLASISETSVRRAAGGQIDLHYAVPPGEQDSRLREAFVKEDARVEFEAAGTETGRGGLRRLSAGWIRLEMRPGGDEVRGMETLTPGRLEILPAEGANSWRRTLTADRIRTGYGPGSRLENLDAAGNVALRNEPPQGRGGKASPLLSWSNRLEGRFDPQTGELAALKQWDAFRFEQGPQSGSAEEAVFDTRANRTMFRGQARVDGPESSVSASAVVLDDEAGTMTAEGDVSSVHAGTQSGQEKGEAAAAAGVFSPQEPVFATAAKMLSDQRSGVLEYHGGARLWQGESRIEAEEVVIRRRDKKLQARGNVSTRLTEEQASAGGEESEAGARETQLVYIQADTLDYDDTGLEAVYRGDVVFKRENLLLQSRWLRALLRPVSEDGGGRLHKAFAKGGVRLRERAAPAETARTAFAENAEYVPSEETVILRGGPARLVEPAGDQTHGAELIYSTGDGRLLVLGGDGSRAYSYRRREP